MEVGYLKMYILIMDVCTQETQVNSRNTMCESHIPVTPATGSPLQWTPRVAAGATTLPSCLTSLSDWNLHPFNIIMIWPDTRKPHGARSGLHRDSIFELYSARSCLLPGLWCPHVDSHYTSWVYQDAFLHVSIKALEDSTVGLCTDADVRVLECKLKLIYI